jgi:hypothetical protein
MAFGGSRFAAARFADTGFATPTVPGHGVITDRPTFVGHVEDRGPDGYGTATTRGTFAGHVSDRPKGDTGTVTDRPPYTGSITDRSSG